MARHFVSTSSQYLNGSPPVTAMPFTVNLWFRSSVANDRKTLWAIGDSSTTTHYFSVQLRGANEGGAASTVTILARAGGALRAAVTSTTYSTGTTWQMATGVCASATNRAVYLDGGGKNTSTQSVDPAGIDTIALGALAMSSATSFHDGDIALVEVWNVALSDADIADLYNGGVALAARTIRPDAIVAVYNLLDADGDINWAGNSFNLTPNASPTYLDHPPIILSSIPIIIAASLVTHALVATDIATSATTLSQPTLSQVHSLVATDIATSATTLSQPTLSQIHSLVATDIATSATTLSQSTLSQTHSLVATDIATSATTLSQPTLSSSIALVATDIATSATTLSQPNLSGGITLVANDIATSATTLSQPNLSQTHSLVANDIATLATTLSQPTLSSNVALVANDIATLATTLLQPTLSQTHSLVAIDIAMSAITLLQPTLNQTYVLTGVNILTSTPTVSQPNIRANIIPYVEINKALNFYSFVQ